MNISYQIIKRLGLRKSLDPKEAFLIFGDPRSGSTWLAELIGKATQRLVVDEPLNLNFSKDLYPPSFGWRQDIPDNQDWPEAKAFIDGILNGSSISSECLHKNSLPLFLKAEGAVFKINRGKRLLHWLKANYQFEYKPIFLIREPLAMIHSLSKHSSWSKEFKPYKLPDTRNIEVYEKHLTFLEGLKSNEEQILSHWCIANEFYFKNDSLMEEKIILKYEDLVRDPEKELKRIFVEWGISNVHLDNLEFRKPSATSNEQTKINPAEQLEKWKKEMDPDRKRKYNQILDYFEVAYK